ncbi:MAG: bifunctional tetrahydrofolate synthase/dihydrofolate synthase [Gammaproteobacteria bacterium]|nr:MAG: bifunctional tetrahydrofolate synthase/dihydrofolate synthase [Gammaproteobacteria bacterium]
MELGLDRVRVVAKRMGLMRPPFCTISVAGTNGKGSTVAMLEAIMDAAGYRVGAYTSPHILTYNERIRSGMQPASDARLCDAFEHIERARGDTPLTYFEFGTMAALHLFCEENLDVAVLEVGLGGRLDAVNVVDADVAIITAVDIDHTRWLGDDRERIGHEKAGIFRAGRPAICADPDPPQSVLRSADAVGARLLRLGRDFRAEPQVASWCWRSLQRVRAGLPYPTMRGAHQLHNAAGALMALEALSARLPVSQSHVRSGLLSAVLPGRFQTLPGMPVRVLDVAHNAQAASALAQTLKQQVVSGRTYAVVGMLRDKPAAAVMAAMAAVVDRWYLATLPVARGATAEQLCQALAAAGAEAPAARYDDVPSAYRAACSAAGAHDRIVVFGSFHTVSDIISLEK